MAETTTRGVGTMRVVVFLLDESSQFYIGFSAWTRGGEEENEDGEE